MLVYDEKKVVPILIQCFSDAENAQLGSQSFNQMRLLLGPSFENVATSFGYAAKDFDLNQLRAILLRMAATMKAKNLPDLKEFNTLFNKQGKKLLAGLELEQKKQAVSLILDSDSPLMTAIYFAAMQENWAEHVLVPDDEAQQERLRNEKRSFNVKMLGIVNTRDQLLTPKPHVGLVGDQKVVKDLKQKISPFLLDDYMILNFADRNIPDGSMVLMPDEKGHFRLFQAKHLLVSKGSETTGYKGLTCIAYTSLDPKAPEVKIFFEGTRDFQSGLIDAQRHAPGVRTMSKVDAKLLKSVSHLLDTLHDETGKKAKVSLIGHSLGGANAQSFASSLITATTLQHANPSKSNGSKATTVYRDVQKKLSKTDQDVQEKSSKADQDVQKKLKARRDILLDTLATELPRFEKYDDLDGLAHIASIEVHTKNAPRTSHKNARLAAACAEVLTDKNQIPISHHLSQAGDIVSRAGEEFLGSESTCIKVSALKWNTGKKNWGEKHNAFLSRMSPTKEDPLQISFLLSNQNPQEINLLEKELSKGLNKKSKAVLFLGAELERAISTIISPARKSRDTLQEVPDGAHPRLKK